MSSHCLPKIVEAELRQLSGNNICCDCDAKGPQWASVSFGIFMCLECSGRHRALGVHISFVRSVTMDSWSEKQIQMMKLGGNDRFNCFLKEYDVLKNLPIQEKYHTSAAQYYRERLAAEVNGSSIPTQLPTRHKPGSKAQDVNTSDPLPGESEADYIARQRRLQEEARERMRRKFGQSSGLSSSGRMQGIGSDSTYRPGETSSASIDFSTIDVNQLADASQKALSFFQSSFAAIGEHVSKTTNQILEENNKPPPSGSSDTEGGYSTAWGSLTTGALSLWKQAADATTDIIVQISAADQSDEDYRFPRPPETQYSSNVKNDVAASSTTKLQAPPIAVPPAVPTTRNSSISSVPSPVHSGVNTSASPRTLNSQSSGSQKLKAAPVGDDFFATFGV